MPGSDRSIVFAREDALPVDAFVDILRRSGLAERRPVDDPDCMRGMLAGTDLLITARLDDRLVGVARSVTDFHYCCYLSDLAVDRADQRRGVGRRLIEETERQLGPRTRLILLSAPAAREVYPRFGFERHPDAFVRSVRPPPAED